MSILVSGSLAFDHIMVFPDRFKNHILPDKLHILNVSFNIESLETHFGGCAGNIAYHLRLLGEAPVIVGAAGNDFGSYADWLERNGISRSNIRVFDDVRSTQGFVTTDLDDNQIWAYYEGAMARAHEARIEDVTESLEVAIVSPNGKRAMIEHARDLKARGVPTFIDPSHGLPLLDRDELIELIDGAAGYVVNDYEWSLTLHRAECGEDEIIDRCDAVVITKGEKGATIRQGEDSVDVPPVAARRVVDPTACGDAFRAGLLHGRARGLSYEAAVRIGNLLGSYQVEVEGTQSLTLDRDAFAARLESEYGVTG